MTGVHGMQFEKYRTLTILALISENHQVRTAMPSTGFVILKESVGIPKKVEIYSL